MKSIKKTSDLVKEILETVPATRNNDMLLYYRVCDALNSKALSCSFGYMLLSLKEYNLPSIETVGRCRRKLQAAYPELAAKEEVETLRTVQEEKFRNYAKAVNV